MIRMSDSITAGPASTDDYNDESRHPEEPEYDKYQDDKDFANLRAEMISITRIQSLTSRIEVLTEELLDSTMGRPQG